MSIRDQGPAGNTPYDDQLMVLACDDEVIVYYTRPGGA